MLGVNTALASGHFQNGDNIMPTLDFWRQLAMQCMENTIVTDPSDTGRPIQNLEGLKQCNKICRRCQTTMEIGYQVKKIKIPKQEYQKHHRNSHS